MGWLAGFIALFVFYSIIGNYYSSTDDRWEERQDEVRTNRWIFIATTIFVFIVYGLYSLINRTFNYLGITWGGFFTTLLVVLVILAIMQNPNENQ